MFIRLRLFIPLRRSPCPRAGVWSAARRRESGADRRRRRAAVLLRPVRPFYSAAGAAGGHELHAHERLCESVRELVVALRDEGLPSAWAKDYLLHAAASARRCGEWAAARQWALDASHCVRDLTGRDSSAYRSFAAEHLRAY